MREEVPHENERMSYSSVKNAMIDWFRSWCRRLGFAIKIAINFAHYSKLAERTAMNAFLTEIRCSRGNSAMESTLKKVIAQEDQELFYFCELHSLGCLHSR